MLDRLGVAMGLSEAKVPSHTFHQHILPRKTLVLNKLGLKEDEEQRGDNSIILLFHLENLKVGFGKEGITPSTGPVWAVYKPNNVRFEHIPEWMWTERGGGGGGVFGPGMKGNRSETLLLLRRPIPLQTLECFSKRTFRLQFVFAPSDNGTKMNSV